MTDNPFLLFHELYQNAKSAGIIEPNAMSLATVGQNGLPSLRMVLLKAYDEQGFVFFTNLQSRKAIELQIHPVAALCFYWQPIGKQIRIEGNVTPVNDAEADDYFASRSRGSQIGAWASLQSKRLGSRSELLGRVEEITKRFEGKEISRPSHWSGFRVTPIRFEFWSAGEFRLHDRLVFEKSGDDWNALSLYP